MPDKIIIAGGSGFIGKYVAQFFKNKNFEVIILTRGAAKKEADISYLNWDGKNLGKWAETLEGAKLLLNLAGKSVDCRYTEANKKAILDSRIYSTKILGEAIQQCEHPPEVWMNSSTATIYDHTLEGPANDEENGIIGDDFSMNVAKTWEATCQAIDTPDTRKILLRTSIVLGKEGGALVHLLPLVKFELGGKNGSGQQFVSWIHVEDLARVMEWFLENETARGAYNCTSPVPVRNHFFMKKIREAYGIPFGLPAAKWMIEIGTFFLRSESELVLKSRKVVPKKLLDAGFKFLHEDLEMTLKELI